MLHLRTSFGFLHTKKNDKCAQPKESCQMGKTDGFFADLSQGGNRLISAVRQTRLD